MEINLKYSGSIADALELLPYAKSSISGFFFQAVHDWYLDNDGEHRRLLAVMGYTHMREAQKVGVMG